MGEPPFFNFFSDSASTTNSHPATTPAPPRRSRLARRNCLGERQILVGSTMGQEKPRRSIPPASCPLDGDVKGAGFWFAITHHLVVLDDQAHVMITGAPEFMFQHRAIVAGFHIAASGA